MTIVYYVALIILTVVGVQLLSDAQYIYPGLLHRQDDYKRYWLSILIQAVLAIGFLIYAALQMLIL